MWKCTLCGASIGLFQKHGALKAGQRYLYVRKDHHTYRKSVESGVVGAGDAVRPGRLCPRCWADWQASQREAEAEKAQVESRRQRRQPSRAGKDVLHHRGWVLDNMPVAGHDTLARFSRTLTPKSRSEILSLGETQVEVGVRRYKRGDPEAVFYAASARRDYQWVIVRTGPDAWAIAHYERRLTT